MAVFPNLILEPIVQINDRTRLDASKSFATQDSGTISLVEIDPLGGTAYIDVSSDKFLDWEYSASGNVSISVRVATESATASITKSLSVVTESSDHLFSNDSDLVMHEADIMKWVRDGRNSFLDIHRRAQTIIVKWLDKEGYTDVDNNPYTKAAIVDVEEVKQWATYLVLRLIFESISNAVDDVFSQKAKRYEAMEADWRARAVLRLDIDGDGAADIGEEIDPAYGFVARR